MYNLITAECLLYSGKPVIICCIHNFGTGFIFSVSAVIGPCVPNIAVAMFTASCKYRWLTIITCYMFYEGMSCDI